MDHKDCYLLVPYEEARKGHVFKQDGKYGLETDNGIWALLPNFDQIEICTDFIYAHYEDYGVWIERRSYRWERDSDDDLRFYEDGRIGLKSQDESVLFPSKYDEIIDWSDDCDVVYVRRGQEFHYYNHKKQEILKAPIDIPDEKGPYYPYYIDEEHYRNIVMVIEQWLTQQGDNVCYAFNQWIKLTGVSYKDVGKQFENCSIYSVDKRVLNHFYDDATYIYSARKCIAKGEHALVSCVRKMNTLGCYDSSWEYLIKVSTNRNSLVATDELYALICLFEDLHNCYKFDIALDINDSLTDGEVEMFQVHYYWEGQYGFEKSDIMGSLIANGTLDEIEDVVDKTNEKVLLADAYWAIDCDTDRPLNETIKILEYLKRKGTTSPTTLITEANINPYYLDEYDDNYWNNQKAIISWAVHNGGYLNSIWQGKTVYDKIIGVLKKEADRYEAKYIQPVKDFLSFLRSVGARTAKEERLYRKARMKHFTLAQLLDFMGKCQIKLYY